MCPATGNQAAKASPTRSSYNRRSVMAGQRFRFSADQFQHVADLLGSADWARAVEELIQEQNEFLSDKDVRPWPEIPPQVAGHMLKDLKRGRERAKLLSQWLEELDP